MSTVRRIAKNAAALYTCHIITSSLALVLFILIARILGDTILGKYSFAVAYTAIFHIFLDLGFDTLIVRDIARDKYIASKYLGNIVIIKVILSVIIYGAIAISINLMQYPADTTTAVLIFGIHTVLTSFASIFRVTFRAFERMEFEAIVLIIYRLICVSLGLAALYLGYGLIELAFAFLIGGIFDLLASFLICNKKLVKLKFAIDLNLWKKATKDALPIGFISIATIIYVRIDTVMLSYMKGDEVVGWYNAAYNLVLSLQPIAFHFGTAVLPVMSRLFISSKSSLQLAYDRLFYYMFILGLPLAMGIMLLSDHFILLFYGSEFTHSIGALKILAWDVLLYFLNITLARVLTSINRQNQMAASAGACAILNVILNLILIPHFSYVGAGIATIITETVLFGLYFYLTSIYFYRLPLYKLIIRPIIACIAMSTFIYFFSEHNLAIVVTFAVLIYFSVFLLIKGFTKEDRELISQVFRGEVFKR